MTDVIANMFANVHPVKAKYTLFLECNCFLIASTDSENSFPQMLLRVLADVVRILHSNALS
jgi:hypothetical protein